MLFYRVPYCRPYWSRKTVAALLSRLLTGRIEAGEDIPRLEGRLGELFGADGVVLCDSGRTAIELAFRALGVDGGHEVIVPSFCCRSVLPPILAVKAIPVLADVDESLALTPETIAAAMTARTRAVIIPHLFGNPVEMEAILALCARKGVLVIDDAAQALGATLDGRPLGTFGDAGVLSFGNGKVCFGTGGGALLSNDKAVISRARSIRLHHAQPFHGAVNALSVLVWRYNRRWTVPVRNALRRVGLTSEGRRPYRAATILNVDAAVALTLLDSLQENLARRRARVAAYATRLADCQGVSLFAHRATSACLTQVVRLIKSSNDRNSNVDQLLGLLHRHGYEVGHSYKPLHLFPEFEHYARCPLPFASAQWKALFELPCEPTVSISDVNAISELLRFQVTTSLN